MTKAVTVHENELGYRNQSAYQFRELEFDDIFRLTAIVDAAEVTEEFMTLSMNAQQGQLSQEKLGAKFFSLVIRGLSKPKAAKEIKEFVASMIGVKPSELPKGMALIALLKQIKEERGQELADFFGEAVKLVSGGEPEQKTSS